MVRQARSEATRQKIIDAAVELFSGVGYQDTGLAEIIERAQMTKGALYYHFDSKEALAVAIVEEGAAEVLNAFRGVTESATPALESMIHGSFVVAQLISRSKLAATAVQLSRALGDFSEAASRAYEGWLGAMITTARRAGDEGDLREALDPYAVGEAVSAAMLGSELISNAISGGHDLPSRLARTWQILLPAVANEESLPYFREFLARESLRHLQPALTIE
jgi:AcrR family transcriptional regulator